MSEILIDDAIERKIRSRRQVTGHDVRLACPVRCVRAGVLARTSRAWDPADHRVLYLEGVALTVILQAVDPDEGVWLLRTVLRRS